MSLFDAKHKTEFFFIVLGLNVVLRRYSFFPRYSLRFFAFVRRVETDNVYRKND